MSAGDKSIEVPREAIEKCLQDAGFIPGVIGKEIIYTRTLDKKPALIVKVYTSLSVGADVTRGCGEDAIRVCMLWERICLKTKKSCIWDNDLICKDCNRKKEDQRFLETLALFKDKRVYRTGTVEGVLERMKERMREAWKAAQNTRVCFKCCATVWENGQCKIPQCKAAGGKYQDDKN